MKHGGISAAMAHDKEEARVIRACAEGRWEEFGYIFDKYKDRAFGLALGIVKDRALATDVAQSSFIKVFRSLKWFNQRSDFSTWLYRIVYNQALDQYRRRSTRSRHELGEAEAPLECSSPKTALFEEMANEEIRGKLRAAMEVLPLKLRTAVILRYVEGLSYDEICRVMGCARGVLQRRLSRAGAKLRNMLRREIHEFRR